MEIYAGSWGRARASYSGTFSSCTQCNDAAMETWYTTPFPYAPMPRYPYPLRWRWPVNQATGNASLQANTGALAYSLLSYGAMAMHRRVPWYRLGGQMLHVLPLFLLAQLVVVGVRIAAGGPFPGVGYFLLSLSTTLLWPLADVLLLAPQRRAVDRDETRPIEP